MSYTLTGGNFSRTYTRESLASYSVKLLASQQSHFQATGRTIGQAANSNNTLERRRNVCLCNASMISSQMWTNMLGQGFLQVR